ncbi:MAG: DUF296 domain-containing protein [Myxococcales bacterium]|nr:DUF296 domain-containing protein [Myxococcales bacterium]MCB9628068.1 DUF296 domain-containing protein [Sandaracinaceae bacterium]
MFAKESKRVRHFVGRCERGEDLHAALLALAVENGIQAGWVRGLGALEGAELREYDQDSQRYRAPVRFDTALEVLSLTGNISSRGDQPFVHLHVTLSRETDNGIQLLGGHLERGRVFALEFHVESFDDVALVRERDPATGLHLFVESTRAVQRGGAPAATVREPHAAEQRGAHPESSKAEPIIERVRERAQRVAEVVEPASRVAPSSAAGVTWAMVASASEEAQQAPLPSRPARPARREPEVKTPAHRPPPLHDPAATDAHTVLFDEPIPEVGEYLDHRQFGVCKIERMDDDGGVLLRMPDKRKKLIKLDVLQVQEPRIEGNRIIYPVRPRGPRKA